MLCPEPLGRDGSLSVHDMTIRKQIQIGVAGQPRDGRVETDAFAVWDEIIKVFDPHQKKQIYKSNVPNLYPIFFFRQGEKNQGEDLLVGFVRNKIISGIM